MKKITRESMGRPSKNILELIPEYLELFYSRNLSEEKIKTGFGALDRTIGGLKQGELVIIGGRPAMGKTQLAINFAKNISETLPVLFFTLELSESQLTKRFISSASSIRLQTDYQKNFLDFEKLKISQAADNFSNHKLFINDKCSFSFSSLVSYCQNEIQVNGIKVIFIDYLQLLDTKNEGPNRVREMENICRKLKEIALQYNVCIIALSQLSKTLESREGTKYPLLTDIPDAGSVLPFADKVIFIYRPAYYGIDVDEDGNDTTNIAEIIVARNRSGETGIIPLLISRQFTNYLNLE